METTNDINVFLLQHTVSFNMMNLLPIFPLRPHWSPLFWTVFHYFQMLLYLLNCLFISYGPGIFHIPSPFQFLCPDLFTDTRKTRSLPSIRKYLLASILLQNWIWTFLLFLSFQLQCFLLKMPQRYSLCIILSIKLLVRYF